MSYTNTRVAHGDLTVSKKVEGPGADTDRVWVFHISLKGNTDDPLAGDYPYEIKTEGGSGDSVTGWVTVDKDGSVTIKDPADGDSSIKLKHNQSITIKGLPENTSYTVTEDLDGNYTSAATPNANGTIEANDTKTVEFTNTRKSGQLSISKTVTGGDGDTTRAFQFKITLTDSNGPVSGGFPCAGTFEDKGGDDSIDNNQITFTKGEATVYLTNGQTFTITGLPVGVTYRVEEEDANKDGYSTTPAAGDTTGTLGETGASVTFTNHKPTSTTFTPGVTKTISGGRPSKNETFTFTLTAVTDGAPMPADKTTVTVDGAGDVSFGAITYTKDGTYEYTIKEEKGTAAGYTYDSSEWKLTVTVTEADGKLTAAGTYSKDGAGASLDKATFTNEYKPAPATFKPTVKKTVEGVTPPEEREFTFTLTAKDGVPMPAGASGNTATVTIKTKDNGTAEFGDITYTEAGTYTYTITEDSSNVPGYTYDESQWALTVVVTDDNGELKVTSAVYTKAGVSDGDTAAFTNKYQPTPTTFKPSVKKTVEGTTPKNEVFTFTLAAETDAPMPSSGGETATVTGNGTADFGEITYEEAGHTSTL